MLQRNADFQDQRYRLLDWQRPFPLKSILTGACDLKAEISIQFLGITPHPLLSPASLSLCKTSVERGYSTAISERKIAPAILRYRKSQIGCARKNGVIPQLLRPLTTRTCVTPKPFEKVGDNPGDNHGASARAVDLAICHQASRLDRPTTIVSAVDQAPAQAGQSSDRRHQGGSHPSYPPTREASTAWIVYGSAGSPDCGKRRSEMGRATRPLNSAQPSVG